MFGVWRGRGKMTPDLPWFSQWTYVHLVFFYSLLAIITIEWGDLYIHYMKNKERGKQVTGPNLNGLDTNIQWIGLFGP